MAYNLKRLTGYALGFILFYAPVALFQRCLFYLLYGSWLPAEYSRPLFSYSDRACVGRNNLAADADKHAEYTVAVGSSVLPGTSFLRQAVPGGCVYRISVEADAV